MHAPPLVRGSTRHPLGLAPRRALPVRARDRVPARVASSASRHGTCSTRASRSTRRLSFGTANIVIALIVLVLAWSLGARIGPGTVANAVLIGLTVDGLLAIDAVDALSDAPLASAVVLMVAGVLMIGIGSGFYIGAAMGAGPRDSLMLVTADRAAFGSVSPRGDRGRRDGDRFRARRNRRDRHARLRVRDRPGRRALVLAARAKPPSARSSASNALATA